jgi:hypothetical protein
LDGKENIISTLFSGNIIFTTVEDELDKPKEGLYFALTFWPFSLFMTLR